MAGKPHITVCICTYRRPARLRCLLEELREQETADAFSYSVVVADNEGAPEVQEVVRAFEASSSVAATYCVEPEQNIARARNKALEHATGEFVAFIDDDEFPTSTWLLMLLKTCQKKRMDGVLGPVKPFFESEPPAWLLRGRFCERPSHPTGHVLRWEETRTGNAFFRREIVAGLVEPFDSRFRNGGEDDDFFRQRMEEGRIFVWCDEAAVYEIVPPERCTRRYLLKRALLRGQNQLRYPGNRGVAKSVLAVAVYAISIPFLLLSKHHILMKYLIRLGDHSGKVLAALGWNPMGNRYITN